MSIDEFTPGYTTLVVAAKARDRYWDGDAVRTAPGVAAQRLAATPRPIVGKWRENAEQINTHRGEDFQPEIHTGANPAGAPLLDWWLVPDAETPLVKAMCPARVCRECGKPSRRIVAATEDYAKFRDDRNAEYANGDRSKVGARDASGSPGAWDNVTHTLRGSSYETLGWTDCGHNNWRPGHIFDPFAREEDNVTSRFMVCDVFDGIATLEDGSVDLVVTSPPFLALRSYLPADHPDKAKEMGSEATPGEFLDRLLDVVEALTPKLAPHASIVFELGDTYAGSGQPTGEYNDALADDRKFARHEGRDQWERDHPISRVSGTRGSPGGPGWPLDKSKVLVPQLFAIALAYGFNPLTGRQTEPWRVRNTVAWCRPNPPVGRDGDKFRPATSFLTVACKGRDRYWDGDAVRVPPSANSHGGGVTNFHPYDGRDKRGYDDLTRPNTLVNPAGAPLLDYWVIPTAPYKGSHYATFPPDLVVPLVKAMCPAKVCRVCGKPSTRIVLNHHEGHGANAWNRHGTAAAVFHQDVERPHYSDKETLGFTDCGHDDWRPGLVLDPFAGSGTTLSVASGHGYDAVGFDLDPRNADLARDRVGMFLEVEARPLPEALTVETE